jgi:hypothetical protein
MTMQDPNRRAEGPENAGPEDTGHERRSLLRLSALAAVALAVFLVGYFLAYGPLDPQREPGYPPAGRNLELENKAAPPPEPKAP